MSATTRPRPRAAADRAVGDRLARLLNLVPYLLARPGIPVGAAAADLAVSERQLREDLELLWVCGLPGYGPGDLIDLAFDGDNVTVTYDAGIDRPLRLTQDEALALVVALRMLAEVPGAHDRGAVRRALAKIEAAAGDAAVELPLAAAAPPVLSADRLADLRSAVQSRHALRITYYTATRDEVTERVVDPMRVLVATGRAYLEAWCRRVGAVRLFRVDRIDSCVELDEPAVPPPSAQPTDLSGGVFTPAAEHTLVTLRIGRWERWITEYYPCERVVEESPERWLVSLRASDMRWARRLVLSLGPGVSVVTPSALAEAVRAEARAALAAYATEPPGLGSGAAGQATATATRGRGKSSGAAGGPALATPGKGGGSGAAGGPAPATPGRGGGSSAAGGSVPANRGRGDGSGTAARARVAGDDPPAGRDRAARRR